MKSRLITFTSACAIPLAVSLSLISTPASAVNRYWVCGDGAWSDTSCWSTSSNGAGGASAPQVADQVSLDEQAAQDYTITYSGPDAGELSNIVIQKRGVGDPELLSTGSILSSCPKIT